MKPIADLSEELYRSIESSKHVGQAYASRALLRRVVELGAETTSDLTAAFVDRFVADLDAQGYKPNTKRNHLRLLRNACAFAVARGYLPASPFDGRPDLVESTWPKIGPGPERENRLKGPRQVVDLLAELERRAMESGGFTEHRLYAFAAVVASMGLCDQDCARLKVADLDFKRGVILVRHRQRDTPMPMAPPMPPNLAAVLTGWLKRRSDPVSARYALDEHKVVEIRRLRAEGWTFKQLGEKFGGAKRHALSRAVKGLTWAHVPKEGDVSRRVADSPWLFPQITRSSIRPLVISTYVKKGLKEAGEAIGAGDVRFSDIRDVYRRGFVPETLSLEPDKSAPRDIVSPVLLGGKTTPPVVLGKVKPVLLFSEWCVLNALLKVYPEGLSWQDLDAASGQEFSRTIVGRLKKKDPDYDAVVRKPGEHPLKVCGIVSP
jgi:integrase